MQLTEQSNPRLTLKRNALQRKHYRRRSVLKKRLRCLMRMGFGALLIILIVLLNGCANTKPSPVLVSPPKPPLPSAELMTPAQPNFLSRIESFLYGLEQKPTPSPSK